MLRELIAWVLNNYLGKYVENLNTHQLSIALLSGEVELENLPLRRDALRNLGLPLEALSGSVGKIKLQVPVRQFRSAPWCILIENVYVVVGPVNLNEWDADAEEQADLDYKLSRLDRYEAKWRAEREAAVEGGYYASSYSGWMSYGTSVVTNIVENLQLKIHDVHIRYEDAITVPDHRFACGITIESLSAQSCDPNWVSGFTTNWSQHSSAFKLVELQNLSFYWDPLQNSETFGELGSSELAEAFKNKNRECWEHNYLISPVSAQARIKRDRSEMPLRTRSRPRLVCDLVLNEVSLSLIDWQYNQMVECIKGLDDIAKFRRFRLLRPRSSIQSDARSWWLYAMHCNGFRYKRRQYRRAHVIEDKKYIEIYSKLITNQNETLPLDEKDLKDKVERERDFDEILNLREYCFTSVPVAENGGAGNKKSGMLGQWFPQWWYSSASKTSDETPSTTPTTQEATTPENGENAETNKEMQFEDEILNALAHDAVDTNSLLKRDAVFGKFDFTLKKGTLDICTGAILSPKTSMIQLLFENLNLNVESRPRSGSHYVGLSLGTVLLKDRITPNTEFPDLIRPQFVDVEQLPRSARLKQRLSQLSAAPQVTAAEPLFILNYERKPLSFNTDYRLLIKSQSLDVVYNTYAVKWLVDFFSKPHQVTAARRKIEAMKTRTKMEFMKNVENIIEGDLSERRTWTLEIDISAPQIIFAEDLTNRNSCVVVVDFGRLQLANHDLQSCRKVTSPNNTETSGPKDVSEEDEAFLTPCSTPPGSPSLTDSPTLVSALSELPDSGNGGVGGLPDMSGISELAIHDKIYDRYNVDLTDLQVIVCKGNERLSFISSKGTSTLHFLDRFSISLHIERRVVFTTDPQYPSLTLSGTLPKLVAHVNENKIEAVTKVLNLISNSETPSPHKSPSENFETMATDLTTEKQAETSLEPEATEEDLHKEASKLILLQFTIDQMTLELQSRGRSIVELQVTGVRAGLSKRPAETNVTLSVHGLLLVDAIQSFGADFELLIASHRHVGMDSVSGSLKQSEPCSPCSPGSPDPLQDPRRPTSPHTITRALNNLQRAISSNWNAATNDDIDALIIVEIVIVSGEKDREPLQVANIQFNNLDIIANQETIVELIAFTNRVFPKTTTTNIKKVPSSNKNAAPNANVNASENLAVRTEITFDFHRLNVLVLRALMRDAYLVGRKVGTFTMSEARIHATLGETITVEGSLGGLQVLDLTPEGINHQRILSVGKDPLTEPPNLERDLFSSLTQEMYMMAGPQKTEKALSFTISRNLNACVDVNIRMASVWYTHCARFMQELSWCATEFKQYIKNLARSIREKATDMALGLVQPRAAEIMTGMTTAVSETPLWSSLKTPGSATGGRHKSKSKKIQIKLDVILDTPVLVVPRSSCSPHVLVAHLGKISVTNGLSNSCDELPVSTSRTRNSIFTISEENPFERYKFRRSDGVNNDEGEDEEDTTTLEEKFFDNEKSIFYDDLEDLLNDDDDENNQQSSDDLERVDSQLSDNLDTYKIDIRNMNLYSLDTSRRKGFRVSALPRAEEFYSCQEDAVAVVHDTAIRLEITRRTESIPTDFITLGPGCVDTKDILMITGSVIKPLRLSLSRAQYEQLIDTTDNIFKVPADLVKPPTAANIETIEKDDTTDMITFEINKDFKRRLFIQDSMSDRQQSPLEPKVSFELPTFIIQLQNEHHDPLIEISFRDFIVDYEKNNQYETNLQISLRSILMEDLLCPTESKHRAMVTSAAPECLIRPGSAFSSYSCPNLAGLHRLASGEPGSSLPDNLDNGFLIFQKQQQQQQQQQHHNHHTRSMCPETPPPSPFGKAREDNLVIYSSLFVDPACPDFKTHYNGLKQTSSIDFNCLNLIISVKSWLVVLNFFGLLSEDGDRRSATTSQSASDRMDNEQNGTMLDGAGAGNTELEISIRSLTVILIRNDYELGKANVSNARFVVSKYSDMKTVEGRLGSVSLFDLTTHGVIYREKFVTSGREALNFVYKKDESRPKERSLTKEATLKIQMSSVRYVHTKRFIAEIQQFFHEFSQLQTPVMRKIKPSESRYNLHQQPTQLGLEIKAGSPIILLPMCSKSDQIIVADLGEFSLENSFRFSNDSTVISIKRDLNGLNEILDVMMVDLVNTDLFTAERVEKGDGGSIDHNDSSHITMDMGGYLIHKKGRSLLNNKCHLKLQVERNMDNWRSHNVPDISVQGTLSKLEADLTLQQYKLVRGFLAYNLGECIDDLYIPSFSDQDITESSLNLLRLNSESIESTWTNLSITLDLQDVSVKLQYADTVDNANNTHLACINFIKSSLKIDSFSDGSLDIDLVSQEILVRDSRSFTENTEKQRNVFTNILQPINFKPSEGSVQAEVHSRRRKEQQKYTILLNNMRVMAILDWLESTRDFLNQIEEIPRNVTLARQRTDELNPDEQNADQMELILNITDSELVFVEKPYQNDTNAVILKSTTVVSFRPNESAKVMSINLNHLEVFSCILGSEEDTALSIIDPVTLNFDIRQGVLDIQLQKQLFIRLSYNDVKMFMKMLESIPKQTKTAKHQIAEESDAMRRRVNQGSINLLIALGFSSGDCVRALEHCNHQLNDAAIWLTQNASPVRGAPAHNPLKLTAIELHGSCISICVIDDCKDADVPLLEVSLSNLKVRQELSDSLSSERSGYKAGSLIGVLASDYFNRALSGWEPLIEPWRCDAEWDYSLGQAGMSFNRLQLEVNSDETLKLNVTTTIVELFQLVRDNWIQDYYSGGGDLSSRSIAEMRRRSPFVPFALKNETGLKLHFTTLVTAPGGSKSIDALSRFDSKWIPVETGTTVPFTFGPPKKLRHHDTHKLNLHQIGVRIDGWTEVGPISVDRVGICFRHPQHEQYPMMPISRIVFEVTLEGAAQKLITVRSALRLCNRLDHPILLKMEHLFGHLNFRNWPEPKTCIVASNEIFNVPLSHVHAFLYFRPIINQIILDETQLVNIQRGSTDVSTTGSIDSQPISIINGTDYWKKYAAPEYYSPNNFQFTDRPVHWKDANEAQGDVNQEIRTCYGNREKKYRIVVCLKREGYPSREHVPGHLIMLWPPIRIHNFLPCDLLFMVRSGEQGRITSAETASIHEIDLDENLELNITLDGFPGSGKVSIQTNYTGTYETDVRLFDTLKRLLILKAIVQVSKETGIQLTIYAQHWLINRTGLPLIYRQDGASYDSAGQFQENEQARLVSPFMFSFSESEGSRGVIVRLGKRYGMSPPWCQPFNIHKDILHRQLRSAHSNETFIIGIEVRRGRGRYSRTNIVTFSPRFQIYNRSSYRLQFSQKCFATAYNIAANRPSTIEAISGCHLPFHWPRLDQEQELCVRLGDIPDCLWSGGIPIHESHSFYVNIRDVNGSMHFLRLEIVLQGATYFLLFGNAQVLPPPIRIDNYSEVPIKFFQPDSRNSMESRSKTTTVKPHASIAYALDQLTGPEVLRFEAPGSVYQDYSLRQLGQMEKNLMYENFIYIAFSGTFRNETDGGSDYDVDSQQLVLGVNGENCVVLVRKQQGDRSQLWRMNNEKQLEHEGSSPPRDHGRQSTTGAATVRYVLDIERPPQPLQYIRLVVRPANAQRRSTQTWRFTEEGRLMCEHSNMCVQASGGFFGLRPGAEAVLGMIVSDSHVITKSLVPIEQAIERQKLRPGSGSLSVNILMDGPIKAIRIRDVKSSNASLTIDPSWKHASHINDRFNPNFNTSLDVSRSADGQSTMSNIKVVVKLKRGLGISIVSSRPCEEISFLALENITAEVIATPSVRSLDVSVGDMQVDNQLLETPCPITLFTQKNYGESSLEQRLPVLQLHVKMLPGPNTNAVIVEHLNLSIRPISIYLEERLILRLAEFMGLGNKMAASSSLPDESDYEAQVLATKLLAANAKRYYFGDLQISLRQMRLSVITASKLSTQLSEIKKSLGLTLIKFEDALIEFKQFTYKHHFETLEVYLRAIKSHYKKELKWQAASILGSVDFLGNPLGFANDLSEGVSGLLFEGSVTSLVKNVTHGISNSTAKLTETLSDGLGRVVLDEHDTEARQRILEVAGGSSSTGDHLVAGFKGLGFGLLGGMTSIVKHTYIGAQADGVYGVFSGLAKGIVGTVTKPVIGVLDLASETANAVRETSRSSNRILPERKRLPRSVTGAPGGLLPPFSQTASKGQQHLFLINKRDFSEVLIAYEPCLYQGEDSRLRLLVSSENVYVFSRSEEVTTIIFSYNLGELLSCQPVSVTDPNFHKSSSSSSSRKVQLHHYIELCLQPKSSGPGNIKRPRVRCQNEEMAQKVSRHINYAKGIYDEKKHTLTISDNGLI